MYALSQHEARGSPLNSIEVFNLGFFGNEFKHETTIEMQELATEIDKWYGRVRDPHVCKYSWASLSNIINIQPVHFSESLGINLILTTCNCERIFVELGTQERKVANSDAEIKDLEKLGLQSDFLITK